MRLVRLMIVAIFGYLVGTFPTDQMAAKIFAGSPDAADGDEPPPGFGGDMATVAAISAKSVLAAGGGALAGGLAGALVGGAAAVVGHFFPPKAVVSKVQARKPTTATSG